MGQKSNPISLRLKKTNQHWNSCWYGDYNYTTQLMEDCRIGAYIQNIYQQTKRGAPTMLLKRGRGQIQAALFLPLRQGNRPGAKSGNSSYTWSLRKDGFSKARLWQREKESAVAQLETKMWAAKGKNWFNVNNVSEKEMFQSLLRSIFVTMFTALGQSLEKESVKRPLSPHSLVAVPAAMQRGNLKIIGQDYGLFPEKQPIKKYPAKTPLKDYIEETIGAQLGVKCKLYLLRCFSAHQNPAFLASQVALSLQERIPFRRLKHRLIREISRNPAIKGVRITCSGRVAARSKKAQKAKQETIQWGQTSLHVFSELVHFASKSAQTTFGKVGVKVWICYNG